MSDLQNKPTTEQLQHLRELLAKATKDPWGFNHSNMGFSFLSGHDGRDIAEFYKSPSPDTELIVALRNLTPSLLDELDKLRCFVGQIADIPFPSETPGIAATDEDAGDWVELISEARALSEKDAT